MAKLGKQIRSGKRAFAPGSDLSSVNGLLPEEGTFAISGILTRIDWDVVSGVRLAHDELEQSPPQRCEGRNEPRGAKSSFADQDFEVLDGGDELILDGLFLQTTPPGSLEAVFGRRFGKVAFLKPLPAFAVSHGAGSAGLPARPIQ